MTHSDIQKDIQKDIQSIQEAIKKLPFDDKSTLENASDELQELLSKVTTTYKIDLSHEHTHLKDILDYVKVELQKEASYLSQPSGFRP